MEKESILSLLKNLPSLNHELPLLGGPNPGSWPPWFMDEKLYPIYEKIASVLNPAFIAEIGSLVGYSLISLIHGSAGVDHVLWVDNEEYVQRSNTFCKENIKFYLEKYGRVFRYDFTYEIISFFQMLRFVPKKIDLIHIDGEHTFNGKMRDLSVAFTLNPNYILIDDYLSKWEVKEVVDFWSEKMGIKFLLIDTIDRGMVLFSFERTLIDLAITLNFVGVNIYGIFGGKKT